VTAELDLNRSTKTSEIWDPDSQVIRSQQTRELQNAANGAGNGGAVSVSTELPGAAENAVNGGGTTESQSTAEETINYEISKTTETAVLEAGTVKRLSVAVAVDGLYQTDGNGTASYQPRTADELAQITSLVRSAIGFNTARGDQVEVVNLQFAERPDVQPAGTAEAGLFDFTRDDLMQGAQMLVTLFIALALVLFVMRPLLRRVLAPEQQPLALSAPGPSGIGGIANQQSALAGAGGETHFAPDGTPMSADPGLPRRPRKAGEPEDDSDEPHKRGRRAAWVNNARTLGESQLETLKTVGELIDDNPRQAAMIVRDWLNNAA
jgi:flagellar M-ring protein FliF